MALKPAICTLCGGVIEVDDSKEAGICPSCGMAFITEKAITNYVNNYVTNNTTNITTNITTNNTFSTVQHVNKTIIGRERTEAEEFCNNGNVFIGLEEYDNAWDAFVKARDANPAFYGGWLGMAKVQCEFLLSGEDISDFEMEVEEKMLNGIAENRSKIKRLRAEIDRLVKEYLDTDDEDDSSEDSCTFEGKEYPSLAECLQAALDSLMAVLCKYLYYPNSYVYKKIFANGTLRECTSQYFTKALKTANEEQTQEIQDVANLYSERYSEQYAELREYYNGALKKFTKHEREIKEIILKKKKEEEAAWEATRPQRENELRLRKQQEEAEKREREQKARAAKIKQYLPRLIVIGVFTLAFLAWVCVGACTHGYAFFLNGAESEENYQGVIAIGFAAAIYLSIAAAVSTDGNIAERIGPIIGSIIGLTFACGIAAYIFAKISPTVGVIVTGVISLAVGIFLTVSNTKSAILDCTK